MASIVLCGHMLRDPCTAYAAGCMGYVTGVSAIGHDVLYVEGSGWPRSRSTGQAGAADELPHESLTRTREILRAHGLRVPVVWVDEKAGLVEGMVWPQLRQRLARADALLDVGGRCMLAERTLPPRRALMDFGWPGERSESFPRSDYDVHFCYATRSGDTHHVVTGEDVVMVLDRLLEGSGRSGLSAAA